MFADSQLVFTRDKHNVYMGGGYLLKSELMECGAPPIFNVANGGRSSSNHTNNSDNDNVNGDTTTGESRSPHNGRRGNRRKKNTVSSLLFSSGTIAVPAGLFLMNTPNNNEAEAVAHSIYDDSRIKRLIASNRSDSSNSNSSDDDADYDNRHRRHGHNASIVSETLYDTLFNMLSPTADKRLYWTNGAKTQRRGHQHHPATNNNNNNNNNINNNSNTRKIKKNKITE